MLRTYHKYSKSYKQLKQRGINNLKININWGQTKHNEGLNKSSNVSLAVNKISMLTTLEANEIPTLEWTTDKETAKEHCPIYCRTTITGSKSKGIIKAETPEEVVKAPLYTKALEDYDEYRVHVMNNKIFYAQKKKPRYEGAPKDVKNLKDYYFGKLDCTRLHPRMSEIAVKTIKALGLDFGAVDIMREKNDLRVLEVNTAPGLDNSTANAYAKAFIKHYYVRNNT